MAVCPRAAAPPTRAIRRCPSAARYRTASVTAVASSVHTEVSPPVSEGCPTATTGSPSRSTRPTRGSSARKSTRIDPPICRPRHHDSWTSTSSSIFRTSLSSSEQECSASTLSTPETNSMYQGSSPSTRAGLHTARPTTSTREPASVRAVRFGAQPSSRAARKIRSRVASDRPGLWLKASDTAPLDTPARAATSLMVTRGAGVAVIGWAPRSTGPNGHSGRPESSSPAPRWPPLRPAAA